MIEWARQEISSRKAEIPREFQAKIDTIKHKNGKDLIEAEEIKKRGQDYIDELYKKLLNNPDNQSGVVTHPEPDILECEVK